MNPSSHAVYQFQTYNDLMRRVSHATPFVLLIKHHEDQHLDCILSKNLLECDLYYANAEELPALPLMYQAYFLPEALGFDGRGQVVTRAHLSPSQFDSQTINAEFVNRVYSVCVRGYRMT